MIENYTVSFFGHRYIDDPSEVEKKLTLIVDKIIESQAFVEFLVGKNGEFDQCAASVVSRVKKSRSLENSALVLILPYLTAECIENKKQFEEYYDEIEIPPVAEMAHFKAAIQTRNREMVRLARVEHRTVSHAPLFTRLCAYYP